MATYCTVDEEPSAKEETAITHPHPNDVLSGRGKFAMFWEGNKYYRALIEANKNDYHVAHNSNKQLIAIKIIQDIHNLNPPGKFLEFEPTLRQWRDIGTTKAIRKTRQALREGAPTETRPARRKGVSNSKSLALREEPPNAAETRQSLRKRGPNATTAEAESFIHFIKALNSNTNLTESERPNITPPRMKNGVRLKELNQNIPDTIVSTDTSDQDSCEISLECNDKLD